MSCFSKGKASIQLRVLNGDTVSHTPHTMSHAVSHRLHPKLHTLPIMLPSSSPPHDMTILPTKTLFKPNVLTLNIDFE
ncbi:hypothetical protein LINPERHAP1_LOCUS16925 [Linum perenne]